MAKQTENKKPNLVRGQVVDQLNRPMANLVVQAFDRDMRSEQLLGETTTNEKGEYQIAYTKEQFSRAEKKSADLLMKVFTPDRKNELYSGSMDELRFNASVKEEINILVRKGIPVELNEFDFILREIAPLIEKVKVADLQETDEQRDISFLSNETGIESDKVEHLVVSHHLGNESKIDPAFFYALLRKNTLLKNDFAKSFHVLLMIDTGTEILPVLYETALADKKIIEQDIKAAVKEMIIPGRVLNELAKITKLLGKYLPRAKKYYEEEQPAKVIGMISRFVLSNKISELEDEYQKSKNDLGAFFNKISSEEFFKSKGDAKEAKAAIALSEVLGFDHSIISQIQRSKSIRKPEDIQKLASMNKAEWKAELVKSAGKMNIAGKAPDKELIDFHASSLVRKMEKRFPSVAYTAQLKREKQPFLENHNKIKDFLSTHEDFELHKTNIDLFLKEKNISGKENDAMRNELKKVQRVFKYVPHYGKTNTLLQNKMHSAQSIVAAGESRFINEIAPKAGMVKEEAKLVFKKAEKAHTAAMLIAGELQDTFRAADIPALRMESLSAKLETVSKDFPNLKSLFQLTDVCACEHCRSVYSPAAYLVEILQFLEKRSVVDLTVPAPPPPAPRPSVKIAKDVLFTRRPGLGDIDLGCENAETPVRYIDLVCELLEDAIAPDPGINFTGEILADPTRNTGKISTALFVALQTAKLPVTEKALIFETESTSGAAADLPHYLRDTKLVCKIVKDAILVDTYKVFRLKQTLSSAEELAAAPEYVNAAAYNILNSPASVFAFKLPFDLYQTEASAYFDRLGISRPELMKDFKQAGAPSDDSIAAEKLGLTDAERKIIITPDPGNQQLYWNTTALTAVDEMKVVDTFLTKSGLSYHELDLLLSLKFIDPAENLFIKNLDPRLDSCDTAQKEISNLDDHALDRIHRFLRLQKKTGWKFETIDEIIWQGKLGNKLLDNTCLKIAAGFQTLAEKTGLKIEELVCCYGEFPHSLLPDIKATLYDSVFQNKAKNGPLEPGLSAESVAQNETAAIKKQLTDFKTGISVCLHIKEQDFDKLLAALPNGDLNFINLSLLFGISRLLKKLKIKAEDFFILKELSGFDVFNSPDLTLKFVDLVIESKDFPLKPADIKFMIMHEAENLIDREIKDEKIEVVLKMLQLSYQKSFLANRSPYDKKLSVDEQKESVKNLLSKVSVLNEEDVKIMLNFIDRNWDYKWTDENFVEHSSSTPAIPADAVKFINDKKLNQFFDTTSVINTLNTLAVAVNPNVEPTQQDFLKAVCDTLSNYNFKTEKQAILLSALSATFKTNADTLKIVLANSILKQVAPGTELLFDLLLAESLIDTDLTHALPVLPVINNVVFAKQYASLRLLHKLLPLVSSFKLDNVQTAWVLKNNLALGWFEPDKIPCQAGQVAVPYSTYSSFAQMLIRAKNLSPVSNPADAETPLTFFTLVEMLLHGSTTRAQWIDAVALLTGYEKENVDAVDKYFNFSVLPDPADLSAYQKSDTWQTFEKCSEYLRKMGVTVDRLKEFIKPVLNADDTDQLRNVLKSLYDENIWLDTLKEITDAIRSKKRNALVAYLLAVNPAMKDANDLFDYFLVDTQMESCMPSSRIVQAHGTIQLFVQRCLMGLEPDAAADLNTDTGWNQWKWMKNYRVWEANRKVFLYPENWIEAELLDDKSFLFNELINESRQNEINDDTSTDLLIRYLEKLDDIAFLDVVATWYQADIYTMHVFARTKGGDPNIYYYRRFEKERYWTPWEKVDLDITGDLILAFVRNNRLYLAWPVFSEEPDPVQKSTVPDSAPGTEVDNEKPKRKLKIQLAISEYANKKWKPKKISKDGIRTPSSYTSNAIPRNKYNLMFQEMADQIWIFRATYDSSNEYNTLNGIFDIAGCKGYPQLAFEGSQFFPDFFPDFKDAVLNSQRYNELNHDKEDDLSVRNAISPFDFYQLLKNTPGRISTQPSASFHITYPIQFTKIDLVALLFEYLVFRAFSKKLRGKKIKIPFGTLLPYFMEDSNHSYVIIPGFYARQDTGGEFSGTYFLTDTEKRTGSEALKLLDAIIALFNKYRAKYIADPAHDIHALLQELVKDSDYQDIVAGIHVFKRLQYGEQFKNMYHPLICSLRKILYKDGIPALMKRETQLQMTKFDFKSYYVPQPVVPLAYPVEDADFSSDGSYSLYNWELFFHTPFLLATRLSRDQRFEEALTWFHYIFNPTGALEGNVPEKYWVTKPFYQTHVADYINQWIDNIFYKVSGPATQERKDLENNIEDWRNKPFKPHVVARFRPVAYQKAVLMKYIDNLTEWGDYLFRQESMESVAQATQMYILADKLLGPKPRTIPPPVKPPYETYNQLEAKLDAFGNALIDIENILPDFSVLPEEGAELPAPPVTLSMLYFCIPQNDNMLEYWNKIANRLFNIRHCRNIDGVERTLALFAPPIDPGMLVRAAAAGLDISSILAGLNAPTPYYRFNVLSQKATELVQELRGLGTSLLQALEKKDAEAMSLLRSELEIKVLKAVRDMKLLSIKEAKEQIEILNKTKAVTEERNKYYTNIKKIIPKEQLNLDKLKEAQDYQVASQIVRTIAGALGLIPEMHIGANGFGGSPEVVFQFGGSALSRATNIGADILSILGSVASYEASRASTLGGYDRRFDDWKLQERLAKRELAQIDKQITAAAIRQEISETDLKNHDLQIDNAQKTDEFMRSKFTNKDLYDWMIGQLSSIYFRAYQLAYDFARKAERCSQHELGNTDTFIEYGYWDSLKKGLQSADHLFHDIKRMETAYLDKNKREYELTKNISLAMLDPLALVRLRMTGVCDFEIPEVLYDMDHAGHYFRRIKSASISMPCIAGPYTSVSAKLSLINNKYRKNSTCDPNDPASYIEDLNNDQRFTYNVGAIQSIAASNSQNDSGLFELNFRDERYLPFEGCGAISSWRLELPKPGQFNYETISDVILHIKYTSREGGSSLRKLAETTLLEILSGIRQQLSTETGLHVAFNMRHDMANEWHLLKKNKTVSLMITKSRLPYFIQSIDTAQIDHVIFIARAKSSPAAFTLRIGTLPLSLNSKPEWNLFLNDKNGIDLDAAFDVSVDSQAQLDNLEELMMIVKYSF